MKTLKTSILTLSLILVGTMNAPLSAQAPNIQWKKNFGGSDVDAYQSVTIVSDGFVAVGYSNANSFNNGDWTGITGKGNRDAFIVKYSLGASAINEVQTDNLKIYVVNGELRIEKGELAIKNMEIVDLTGKTQMSKSSQSSQINVANLPQGVYFLEIQTDKGMVTRKFVKE